MIRLTDRCWIAIAVVGGAALLGGCDGGVSREEPQPQAQSQGAANDAQTSTSQGLGDEAGSALGKAKQTAQNFVEQQQRRQEDLSKLTTPGGSGDESDD